ncbi:MAG: nucleotidyltransferase [Clostridium sp.]
MKITGLITEYNPFHNGHLYHIEKSKEETGADYCIALMSGSFVQRGAPAVYDKYIRTSMALQSGADLVIEMPVAFSTASAKEFSTYAIALFTALGAVDSVCFGSECGLIEPLKNMAHFLLHEPAEYSLLLKNLLKNGMTFPESRNKALLSYPESTYSEFLNAPNNILGIEYCKAAEERSSPLSLYTIKRQGSDYHSCSTEGTLGSATAIREVLLQKQERSIIKPLVPAGVFKQIEQEIPVFLNDFSSMLNYRIWMEPVTDSIADMTSELASRIQKDAWACSTFEERIQTVKSRQITYTRVSRALLHLLLNIHSAEIDSFKGIGYAPYARILGFKKGAEPLLAKLKAESSIPLITKLADASDSLSTDALMMLNQEISASHLYQIIRTKKGGAFKNEYTQPILII